MGKQQNRVIAAVGAISAILAAGGSSVFASQVRVKKGDTLYGYARHYHVSLKSLETLNQVKRDANNVDLIYPGQSIQTTGNKVQTMKPVLRSVNTNSVNDAHTYVVKTGDNLWAIAQAQNTTVADLTAVNGLDGSIIHVGQQLKLADPSTDSTVTDSAQASTSQQATPVATLKVSTNVATRTIAQPATPVKADVSLASKFADIQTTADVPSNAASQSTSAATTNSSVATLVTPTSNVTSDESQVAASASIGKTVSTGASTLVKPLVTVMADKATDTSKVADQTTAKLPQSKTAQVVTANDVKTATSDAAQATGAKTNASAVKVTAATSQATSQAPTSTIATSVAASAASSVTPAASQSAQQTSAALVQNQSAAPVVTSEASAAQQTSAASQTPVSAAPTPTQTNYNANQSVGTKVVNAAVNYENENVPYVWGGASTNGMDCSGLVQQTYAQAGVTLPHNTVAQEPYFNAQTVDAAQPGDVLFWGPQGQTYHNAIFVGGKQYIAAPKPGLDVQTYTMDGQSFMPSFSGSLK